MVGSKFDTGSLNHWCFIVPSIFILKCDNPETSVPLQCLSCFCAVLFFGSRIFLALNCMVLCWCSGPHFSRIWFTTFFIQFQFLWWCGWMEECMRLRTASFCLQMVHLLLSHVLSLQWGSVVSVSEQNQTYPMLKHLNQKRHSKIDVYSYFHLFG